MRIEVVSEDMGARENGARMWAIQKCSFARLRLKLWKIRVWSFSVCRLEDHIGGEKLSSNL